MNRPSRSATPSNNRERLLQDFARSALLRHAYPQLAEVRVEFEFDDDTRPSPSPQAFSYFPAAHGFFRYACPRHSCSGEFDVSSCIAEVAAKRAGTPRTRHVDIACSAPHTHDVDERHACPIGARIRVSVRMLKAE